MKKFLAILMALVLTLSLGVTAFAADGVEPAEEPAAKGNAQETDGPTPDNYTVTKNYTLTGGDVTPAETLKFEVALVSGVEGGVKDDALPTVGTNKDNKVAITSGTTTEFTFPINFPEYSKVGVYTYTVTEKAGTVAGETYDKDPIYVVVTVTNANSGATEGDAATSDKLVTTVAVHKGSATGKKDAQFTNEYGMGKLTVTKTVSGNLASNTKKFTIKVTFTPPTAAEGATAPVPASVISYTVAGGTEVKTVDLSSETPYAEIELSHGQSAEFTNIPAGVSFTVVEDAKHTAGSDKPETTEEGYKVSYTGDSGTIEAGKEYTAAVKNEKKTEVDTGISLDSLPYILIVAVVLAASVVMFVTKRRSEV